MGSDSVKIVCGGGDISTDKGRRLDSSSYTGWLCKIQLSSPAEFEALLSEEAYKKLSEDA